MRDAQALLTLYRPPDCRRRYAEGPGAAPLADSAGHHLDGRDLLLLEQPARSTQLLAVRIRLLQTRLGPASDEHQFLVGHPGGEAGRVYPKNDSGYSALASRYWAQGCSLSARLRTITPHRCRSWMLPMVSSQRRQMQSMDPTTKVSP